MRILFRFGASHFVANCVTVQIRSIVYIFYTPPKSSATLEFISRNSVPELLLAFSVLLYVVNTLNYIFPSLVYNHVVALHRIFTCLLLRIMVIFRNNSYC